MNDGNNKAGGKKPYYGGYNQNSRNNSHYSRSWNNRNNERTPFFSNPHHGGGRGRGRGGGGAGMRNYNDRINRSNPNNYGYYGRNNQYVRHDNNNNEKRNVKQEATHLQSPTTSNKTRQDNERNRNNNWNRDIEEEVKRLKGVNKDTWNQFTLKEKIQSQVSTCSGNFSGDSGNITTLWYS